MLDFGIRRALLRALPKGRLVKQKLKLEKAYGNKHNSRKTIVIGVRAKQI